MPLPQAKTNRLRAIAQKLWTETPKALVAIAHPDDAEITFGATILRLVNKGWRVYILVATNGQNACTDNNLSSSSVIKTRRAEQIKAAKIAGVSDVFFLKFPDTNLEFHKRKLKERVTYYIRKIKPHSLYTFDPTTFYFHHKGHSLNNTITHPDHRAIGDASLSAVYYGSPFPRVYPEHKRKGLLPWLVKEVFLGESNYPNFQFNERPYIARKRKLIQVYSSQAGISLTKSALKKEGGSLRLIRPYL